MDDTVIDQVVNPARTAAEAGAPRGSSPAGTALQAASAGQQDDRSKSPSCEARRALRFAVARLAVGLASGPAGVAAVLRTGLLDKPCNTPGLPLDIGCSDTIPWYIRRAVLLRGRKCAWPRCGRPAVYCDVRRLRHKQDGGETSLENCVLACRFHHDVCIHRGGWQLIVHPDGTTEARSPDGRQILHSHAPPTEHAA